MTYFYTYFLVQISSFHINCEDEQLVKYHFPAYRLFGMELLKDCRKGTCTMWKKRLLLLLVKKIPVMYILSISKCIYFLYHAYAKTTSQF